MIIMLKGENGKRLIELAKEKIASLRLPPGVKISPFYDQAFVIDGTIHTVEKNLFEGFVLVAVVRLIFLGNFRAALITASIIPFSMLISFLGMRLFGISANLMSLGAIDFGMIVDAAVVMMEHSVHQLEEHHALESPIESVRRVVYEVVRPMTFAVGIIIAVYLPILYLQVLALTMIPMLVSFSFRKGLPPRAARTRMFAEEGSDEAVEQPWMEKLNTAYVRRLEWAMDHQILTVGLSGLVLAAALGSLFFIGTEFMPQLDEGSIIIYTPRAASPYVVEASPSVPPQISIGYNKLLIT